MKKKLNLKELLIIVQDWNEDKKNIFLRKISQNVPIGIRVILNREDLNDTEKIEAIRWINEFQHEMNKIANINKNPFNSKKEITSISNYIKLIISKSEGRIGSEIAFCFNNAFNALE